MDTLLASSGAKCNVLKTWFDINEIDELVNESSENLVLPIYTYVINYRFNIKEVTTGVISRDKIFQQLRISLISWCTRIYQMYVCIVDICFWVYRIKNRFPEFSHFVHCLTSSFLWFLSRKCVQLEGALEMVFGNKGLTHLMIYVWKCT